MLKQSSRLGVVEKSSLFQAAVREGKTETRARREEERKTEHKDRDETKRERPLSNHGPLPRSSDNILHIFLQQCTAVHIRYSKWGIGFYTHTKKLQNRR
jgi:hypothetical protein